MLFNVTPSTALPVSLADIKNHLLLNEADSTPNSQLTQYILAARDLIERETGKVLVPETWEERLPYFPILQYWQTGWVMTSWNQLPWYDYLEQVKIELQKNPVSAVNTIKYYDPNGTLQTISSSLYYVTSPAYLPSFVMPVRSWPSVFVRPDAVQINYNAGWTVCPPVVQQAVRFLVGTWFSQRENLSEKSMKEIGVGFERVLNQIRSL